jgi:hypothetical protein
MENQWIMRRRQYQAFNASKDEVIRKGNAIVVFHFRQGSSQVAFARAFARLIQTRENSDQACIEIVMQAPYDGVGGAKKQR